MTMNISSGNGSHNIIFHLYSMRTWIVFRNLLNIRGTSIFIFIFDAYSRWLILFYQQNLFYSLQYVFMFVWFCCWYTCVYAW